MANNMVGDGSDAHRVADIERRQGRVVTQTVTRPSTTFTAYVTLGSGPASDNTVLPAPAPIPTTTALEEPAPTTPTTVVPAPSSSSTTLTSDQIGIILGSVFGFIFLLLAVCTCLHVQRRRRRVYYDSETSEDEVIEVTVGGGGGGGGDPWNRPGRMPGLVPPPTRIPPTPRHTTYRQTRNPQIRGVQRYP
ncbi:hypothetical protein B0H66DRAFT_555572 [Apodospora peruviana]|uniref:Uncharacterized protein n=1 Tax=Apodospora peruviana TaxID=516989 RepID=A0AAE0ID72_9PEZI|nr:hypothetical protein B0H66DRAFT_555572 [Apodospora peruviana]